MSPNRQAPLLGAEMRAMRRELAGASDQHVMEVLRLVDGLADRSAADGLLAPLRNRLRMLRPARPVRFARLLMAPLDPVIVDPPAWRPGKPVLPRNAITPLAEQVHAALPYIAAEVDRMGATPQEPSAELIGAAGRILWSDAATTLSSGLVPPSWAAAGLPSVAYAELAAGCATVLAGAWRLFELADPAVPSAELNEALVDMLREAEGHGPVPWGMLLTIMLQRFATAPAPLLATAAKRANRDMRQAAEHALEAAWAWVEAATGDPEPEPLEEQAVELRLQVGLLAELARDATHRRRATALQAALRSASTARFVASMDAVLVAPLQGISTTAPVPDAVMTGLEHSARALRRLDTECRRLGSAPTHDAKLAEAAARITARDDIPPMDRARLVEILLGAQAAMRLVP
jgi:hypothetical protein